MRRRLAALQTEHPGITLVDGGDAADGTGAAGAIPFAELERLVTAAERSYYGRERR